MNNRNRTLQTGRSFATFQPRHLQASAGQTYQKNAKWLLPVEAKAHNAILLQQDIVLRIITVYH